ncbi:replication factor-A carboxy-terminal domain protein [Trifolium pratense]|uniref:Replication factor-A carboxy-terminal domain protein n=2 Tax=Trifolium pratense TaxID=57577 RepID=A0A2K3L042_TRIPR|nr:replication factor-A carboxy-terminal domain protein [Trifolium pratense]
MHLSAMLETPSPEFQLNSVSIQNVVNATRVLVDPEAAAFKDGLALHGVRPSIEEVFLHSYLVMSVSDLNLLVDDETFVVAATIVGLVRGDDRWYPTSNVLLLMNPNPNLLLFQMVDVGVKFGGCVEQKLRLFGGNLGIEAMLDDDDDIDEGEVRPLSSVGEFPKDVEF